jgi:uncharacterized paraquat-inducible protein A
MTLVMFGLMALATPAAAGAGYWWARSRRPAKVPHSLYCCTRCRQKLRGEAGRRGVCPRCMKGFTFPAAPVALGRASA